MASAFPTLRQAGASADEFFRSLSQEETNQLLAAATDRYLGTSGLFGTVDDALTIVRSATAAGVDEIACLIDFGVDSSDVIASFPLLAELRSRAQVETEEASAAEGKQYAIADLITTHHATHLQCTPSMLSLLLADPASARALAGISHLLVGGEALSPAIATETRRHFAGRFTNMYGPTETTVWSLAHELPQGIIDNVAIGKPIANTTAFVVDHWGLRRLWGRKASCGLVGAAWRVAIIAGLN